jgi:hypothetical protein
MITHQYIPQQTIHQVVQISNIVHVISVLHIDRVLQQFVQNKQISSLYMESVGTKVERYLCKIFDRKLIQKNLLDR